MVVQGAAGEGVVGFGVAVAVAQADFAVGVVGEVVFKVGEDVVALHVKVVPVGAGEGFLWQRQQFAVFPGGQAVIRRDVPLLVKVADACGGVGGDVPVERDVGGFVVVVFFAGLGDFPVVSARTRPRIVPSAFSLPVMSPPSLYCFSVP